MRILLLDIETAPNIAYVWRFFKENVGVDQVHSHSRLLSYAAKWLGEGEIYYEDTFKQNEKALLKRLNKLLEEADFIIAHNGQRFDAPKIRGRALVQGLAPTSPFKVIDTCLIARKEFGFESNSLKYLAKVLGCTDKDDHKKFPGFKLWEAVLRDDPEAWAEMQEYNIQDILTLEEIYMKIRPYASNHPNVSVANGDGSVLCPVCGGEKNHKRGFAYTNTSKFQRYQCQAEGCGKWHRSRYTENTKEIRQALTTSI